MHFHKFPHHMNCSFNAQDVQPVVEHFADGISRVSLASERWQENHIQTPLDWPVQHTTGAGFTLATDGSAAISTRNGKTLLESAPFGFAGVCGQEHLFCFTHKAHYRYYGLGEKMLGLEHNGVRTGFWNTDALADFPIEQVRAGDYDPAYVSIPYLIINCGSAWIGLLLNNPEATCMNIAASENIEEFMDHGAEAVVTLGARSGQADLVIIQGENLAQLTRRFQKLVGTTPLPPAWSLGYQQCRYGYKSSEDLETIASSCERYEIPCDGIWLDIEYMDGYRVFTHDESLYPEGLTETVGTIRERGFRVVPILDPGVKWEDGNAVHDSGLAADIFCYNSEKQPYVGLVWPGRTLFPDYSLDTGKKWWAEQVSNFTHTTGFAAYWLDMNDPSTGCIDNEQMRFQHGTWDHAAYHNQYANGMSQASYDGLRTARPDERPFLLTRSASTGIQRYAAIWNGDSVANWDHLKKTISCAINLSLSGAVFNGTDIGGFFDETEDRMLIAWQKANLLFPFIRNHAANWTRSQEPWAYDEQTLDIIRHYIRLRYSLRPYLYHCFIEHNHSGEAILRPMFYDFDSTEALNLDYCDDQFMCGPAIMQAPILEDHASIRQIVLPGNEPWYSIHEARWVTPGIKLRVELDDASRQTPLYFRHGHIIPMARNSGADTSFDSGSIDLHILLNKTSSSTAQYTYHADDGLSFGYQRGERSSVTITAAIADDVLTITTEILTQGYGHIDIRFVCYDDFEQVLVNNKKVTQTAYTPILAGKEQPLIICTE